MSVRSRIKQALESVGYYRDCLARSPLHGVAVLTYHAVRNDRLPDGAMRFEPLHVRSARFEEHCAVLHDLGCTPLSFADWRDIARDPRRIPPSAVMLTFDDGYRSVLTEALPILERYEVPAIVFVCTGPAERRERFWYDALAEKEDEAAVCSTKALDYATWRATIASTAMKVADDDPHAPLTVSELRQLAAHPLITIGAHTITHPILRLAPPSVQAMEIRDAKATLEAWIGRRVDAFAYPNGQPGIDFDERTVDIVGRCGFEHAFTTVERFAVPSEPPLEHPRFTMLHGISASELAHRLAISWPRAAVVGS